MSWYNESRRHSLARRGIKTAIDNKPIMRSVDYYEDEDQVLRGHCSKHGAFVGDAVGCPSCFAESEERDSLMDDKQILGMTKEQLKEEIKKYPSYMQPKWLYKATKNEMAGWLMTAIKVMEDSQQKRTWDGATDSGSPYAYARKKGASHEEAVYYAINGHFPNYVIREVK